MELVTQLGLQNWIEVAKGLPGRTAKQCNAKWFRCMDPNINRERWSNEENAILKHGHAIFGAILVLRAAVLCLTVMLTRSVSIILGSKWAELARMLPGRTDKSVRNHWICSVKYARLQLEPGAEERDEGRRGKEAYSECFVAYSSPWHDAYP